MPERRILSEPGVLFRREDCAGVARRLIASAVDGTILLVVTTMGGAASWFVFFDPKIATLFWLGATTVLWTIYLGVLKRSAISTPGYRIAGIRVVSLDGGVPGHWPMFLRSTAGMLWLFRSPPMLALDLLRIGQDEQRQTLRDKLAGTIVVRSNAVPTAGIQTVRVYSFIGWTVLVREVKPAVAPAPPPHIA